MTEPCNDIKLLIVDDETLVRENLIAFCEDEGYSVDSAESGEKAVELLKNNRYDIGIIDMRLPGIDGNVVIIKAHESNIEMKFIIHTGSTNYSLPPELIDIGLKSDNIMRKPISDMESLKEKILELAEKQDKV